MAEHRSGAAGSARHAAAGTGMVGLVPKVGQISPKLDKSGAFSDTISVHLALPRKIPGFVPFGTNLTHFGAKPTIPDLYLNCLYFLNPGYTETLPFDLGQ